MSLKRSLTLTEIILTVYLISAFIYRVDFGFGLFSFKVTPSLLMSLVIIIYFCIYISLKKNLQFEKVSVGLLLYITLLISYMLLTLIWGFYNTLQLKRFLLFVISLISSLIFILLFNITKDKELVLSNFIKYSTYIYIFFCILQIYYFEEGKYLLLMKQSGECFIYGFINPYPQSIGPYFPRLTGGFTDPNLAGYALSLLFFLSEFIGQKKYQPILLVLIILTFSRSAILGFLISFIIYKLLNFLGKKKSFSFKQIFLGFLKIFSFLILGMLIYIKYISTIKLIISIRLGSDLTSGSGKTHLELIKYAIQKLNGWYAIFGYGFNSSYIFAQKFFPGNKYANFHSEYITFLFEGGVIGLFIYLLIYIFILNYFFLKRSFLKEDLALVMAFFSFVLFNIFYQQFIFNYYWTLVFLITYLLLRGNHKLRGVK